MYDADSKTEWVECILQETAHMREKLPTKLPIVPYAIHNMPFLLNLALRDWCLVGRKLPITPENCPYEKRTAHGATYCPRSAIFAGSSFVWFLSCLWKTAHDSENCPLVSGWLLCGMRMLFICLVLLFLFFLVLLAGRSFMLLIDLL